MNIIHIYPASWVGKEALTSTEAMLGCNIRNSMTWTSFCRRTGLKKSHTPAGSLYLRDDVRRAAREANISCTL